ncbi:hypothetical protein AV530_000645 [Patagioenas fasciata monilis]|uniref:Uncharacterized protein n=1 Tax=Patagioenas fasciata monilis TaxID=372326 RepID=A0A1V4IGC7_PATFA|nr:hypothetical protein AV530_000645 [Patagioenas fasciata monilis]
METWNDQSNTNAWGHPVDQYCCRCHHLQLHWPVLDVSVPRHSLWSIRGSTRNAVTSFSLQTRPERWLLICDT